MLLQFGALGVTMSWDDGLPGARASRPHNDGFLGARASRPHQAWHSLGHLPTWINRERRHGSPSAWPMGFPPTGGCLQHRTEAQRRPKGQNAGETPALPGNHSPLEGESQKPSRQAKGDAVGGGRRATSQKADVRPLGNSRLRASRAPARPSGSFEEKRPIVNEDEPRYLLSLLVGLRHSLASPHFSPGR